MIGMQGRWPFSYSILRRPATSTTGARSSPNHLTRRSRTVSESIRMPAIATAASLDHLVLTVKDLQATVAFYEKVLGMRHVAFTSKGTERHALSFGRQKINLHISGSEFEPRAQNVQPGSGDLCFLVEDEVDEVCKRLHDAGIQVLEGGGVVDRTGAQSHIRSVYVRDPDGNLIELSNAAQP